MKNPAIQNNRVLDFLNGFVKKSTNKIFEVSDLTQTLIEHREREYTFQGSLDKTILYDLDGSIKLKQISDYGSNGDKRGFYNYDRFGNADSAGKYKLDSSGRIVGKYFNGQLNEIYRYESNRIVEQLYCNSGGQVIYTYLNDNSYVDQQVNYQNGVPTQLLIFKNDSNGNILEKDVFQLPENVRIHSQKFEYNEFGDEVYSYVELDSGGKKGYRNDYEYDLYGNWTFKLTRYDGSAKTRIVQRNLEYYPQAILLSDTPRKIKYEVLDFDDSNEFVAIMKGHNFEFEVYKNFNGNNENLSKDDHKAIWVGSEVPIVEINKILKVSKEYYPHLQYVSVSDFEEGFDGIFIGGSTSSAIEMDECKPLTDEQFAKLHSFTNFNDFNSYLLELNSSHSSFEDDWEDIW